MLDQWRITVPEDERVRLTFTSFDLVPEVCGDFVQVYDGHEAGSSSFSKHDIMLYAFMFPVCSEEYRRNLLQKKKQTCFACMTGVLEKYD